MSINETTSNNCFWRFQNVQSYVGNTVVPSNINDLVEIDDQTLKLEREFLWIIL